MGRDVFGMGKGASSVPGEGVGNIQACVFTKVAHVGDEGNHGF